MALHEFSIYIVPCDVRYVEKESTWGFEGDSHITREDVVEILQSICKKLKDKGDGFFSDQECLDMHIVNKGENIKVLEIKGCLSCYMQGIERAYQIAETCEKKGIKVYFNVLGNSEEVGELESFISFVRNMYDDKIDFFQKGHAGFCYVIPPSKFYSKLKWYRIGNKIKKWLRG